MVADANVNISFLDVACLLRITPDTTLEKFGSLINASVFDAANLAGTLKQKGLVDFSSGFPGPTAMQLTDSAKALINELDAKAGEPLDSLDEEILFQLSGGKRIPSELQTALNIVPRDLAFRLYKLYKQNLLNYELKNGNVELLLTEQGFLRAKEKAKAQQTAQQAQPQAQAQAEGGLGQEVQNEIEIQQALGMKKSNSKKGIIGLVILIIILIIVLLAVLAAKHII